MRRELPVDVGDRNVGIRGCVLAQDVQGLRRRLGWRGLSVGHPSSLKQEPRFAPLSPSDAKLAILIAMSLSEQMSLADVKNRMSEVVERLEREHGRVVITKHGHPAAVLMSIEDLESLEETLDIMDSADLLADIRASLADVAAGSVEVLTKDQAQNMTAGR